MEKKPVPTVTKDQKTYVSDTTKSTANRIKYLQTEGFSRSDISRVMSAFSGKNVSYQWVKNVLDKQS